MADTENEPKAVIPDMPKAPGDAPTTRPKYDRSFIERAIKATRGELPDDAVAQAAAARWKARVYRDDIPEKFDGDFRTLLENYSGIPPGEITEHMHSIRDKAWRIFPYPCIGGWFFVNLGQTREPRALAAKARLLAEDSTDVLLEVACCVGQFLRAFVDAGVPASRLYGTDLHPEFIELGYELFRDRGKLPEDCFVAGDMLIDAESVPEPEFGTGDVQEGEGKGEKERPKEEAKDAKDERQEKNGEAEKAEDSLARFDGRITMVHAANFFHLFSWPKQVVAGIRIVRFLKPDAQDAFIFGGQIGLRKAGDETARKEDPRYLHDGQSFQDLWDEIGAKTGTKWRVEIKDIGKSPFSTQAFGDREDQQYFLFGVYKLP